MSNMRIKKRVSGWENVPFAAKLLRQFWRFFRVRNHELNLRFSQLFAAARLNCPEVRFTWPQLAWCEDAEFNRFLDRFDEQKNPNTHRKWNVFQLLRLVETIDGHTAECGVFMGASSYLMAASNHKLGARFEHHAFDSFEGLIAPGESDGGHWTAGDLSYPLKKVQAALAEFGSRVVYHPGWIPERFPNVSDLQFRFVHVDVDLYQPTLDSVEFFYPRLSPGGILVCDDYMFTTCPGATKACDEFLADKPEKMISLASGGGYLIKGITTLSNPSSSAPASDLG